MTQTAQISACNRCGRVLTDPKSVAIKYGPDCLSKINRASMDDSGNSTGKVAVLPFDTKTMDVVCRRISSGPQSNIAQRLVYHSSTGMEWGYGGSGPADFALNILYRFTGDENFSKKWHQEFKQEFVSTLPADGGTISGSVIIEWIQARRVIAHSQLKLNLGGGRRVGHVYN